jgi:chromosomal replication initiator protein
MKLIFEIQKPCTPEDYEYLKGYISDYLNRDRSVNPLTATAIINIVYDHMGCDVSLIKSKSRDHELIVFPRQVSHFFLKKLTKLSLDQIGEKAGNMHHATVLHGIRTVQNHIDCDKSVKKMIEELEGKLR